MPEKDSCGEVAALVTLKIFPSDDELSAGGGGGGCRDGGLCMCTVILGLLQWGWDASLPPFLPHAVIICTGCACILYFILRRRRLEKGWSGRT